MRSWPRLRCVEKLGNRAEPRCNLATTVEFLRIADLSRRRQPLKEALNKGVKLFAKDGKLTDWAQEDLTLIAGDAL